MPSELFLVADGAYVEELYNALKHAGVIAREQVAASGSLGSICSAAAITFSGITKLVAFMACKDPKYVVGEITSMCACSSSGKE